uniref:Uncharacterized protein n=1 Tax=viral metagenome TaxID=1070528 RepID=A0A6H1ZQT8_9ZZZZ
MLRRSFLKWCGIAPLSGLLGVKIPWLEPEDPWKKAQTPLKPTGRLKKYNDIIILDQKRKQRGPIAVRHLKFDPENYEVIGVNAYKS